MVLLSAVGILFLFLGLWLIAKPLIKEFANKEHDPDPDYEPLGWGLLITGIFVAFPFISLKDHLSDLITIETNDELVAIYRSQVDELSKEFKDIDMTAGALMNADTPIATIIQAKVDLTKKLTGVKVLRYNARKSILERKIGAFWWIPLLFDDPAKEPS